MSAQTIDELLSSRSVAEDQAAVVAMSRDSESSDGRGEVMARGPNIFAGYLNLPEKTENVLDEDGWFRTGDTGEIDADGYLRLHGRESSMIVLSGGENVDPEPVEGALQAIAEVREVGVLAHEDRLAAVFVPESDLLREVAGEDLEKRVKDAVKKAAKELPSHHRPGCPSHRARSPATHAPGQAAPAQARRIVRCAGRGGHCFGGAAGAGFARVHGSRGPAAALGSWGGADLELPRRAFPRSQVDPGQQPGGGTRHRLAQLGGSDACASGPCGDRPR
jgi:acyl-CoA synthetase (AMP-forming)/AMP-acid ligase II